MTAVCDECGWTGTSSLVDAGRCPECRGVIRYDSKPLQAAPKLTPRDFFARVIPALRSVSSQESGGYLDRVIEMAKHGATGGLTAAQQNTIFRAVLHHEKSISDRAVVDFATMNARGAD